MGITDEQWAVVQTPLPERTSTRGRPRQDDRAILNDILWVMRTDVSVNAELTLTPTVSLIATSQALPDTVGLTLQNVAAL
jgi:transposase